MSFTQKKGAKTLKSNLNFAPFTPKYIMKTYGYLFGFIKLIKDTHHDEVFIERNGVVIIRNNLYLHTYDELVAIARELGYGKVTIIDYEELEQ